MEHGGNLRGSTLKGYRNDGKSFQHHFRTYANSSHDSSKNGKKSTFSAKIEGLPAQSLTRRKLSNGNCRVKNVNTAFEMKDDFCKPGLSPCSDASNKLHECMSEESANMEPKTLSPSLKSIVVSNQISSFFKDESLKKYTEVVPEEVPPDERVISFDDMPWPSDGSSVGSPVKAPEPTPSTLEITSSTHFSQGYKFKESSIELEVRPQKSLSLSERNLKNRTKELLDGCEIVKQKKLIQMMGFKEKEKQKREPTMIRSSLPVKNSLLDRVKAKNIVDPVLEHSIIKENSTTMVRTVNSNKPKHAVDVMPDKGPPKSFSHVIIKKKPLSPSKKIQLSPKPLLMSKTVTKSRSPVMNAEKIISQRSNGNGKFAWNSGMAKFGGEKTLKQVKAIESSNSTIIYAPGLISKKLVSVKNQLAGVAQKPSDQRPMKMNSQLPSKTLSLRSSLSPSFVPSNLEDAANKSKKNHFNTVKARAPLHPVDQKPTKLKSQQLSFLTPKALLSSPAFVSSNYKEENDVKKLVKISEGKGKMQFCSQNSFNKMTQERTAIAVAEDELFSLDNFPLTTDMEASTERESSDLNRFEFVHTKEVFEAKNIEDEGIVGFKESEEANTASSLTVTLNTPVVVPCCQDVQEMNGQGLINVVIEGIAAKRVVTKNSKVKNLVSAFESRASFKRTI